MKQNIRAEDGQTLIYVALGMVVLLGIVALAIDGGHLYAERRAMQNAADAGALAGARELCLGLPADTAEAVAREYAVTQNGAAWANPVASGYSMFVEAGETSDLFFGGIGGIVPGSADVAAHAQARCVKTGTGCTTWPLTIEQSKFNALSCTDNKPIYITIENFTCPTGCDCSHIFSGVSSPERGWFTPPSASCTTKGGARGLKDAVYGGGYSTCQISTGDCLQDDPGAKVGVFNGSPKFNDWLPSMGGKLTVQLPLFVDYGKTCSAYRVGGFGCIDVTGWIQGNVPLPASATCKNKSVSKVVVATVNCQCTVNCGTGNGDPGPNDARIPVLVE